MNKKLHEKCSTCSMLSLVTKHPNGQSLDNPYYQCLAMMTSDCHSNGSVYQDILDRLPCIMVNGKWYNVIRQTETDYYIHYFKDQNSLDCINKESLYPFHIYYVNLDKKTDGKTIYLHGKWNKHHKQGVLNYILKYRLSNRNSYEYKQFKRLTNRKGYLANRLKNTHISLLRFDNLNHRWIINKNGAYDYIVGQSQNEEMIFASAQLLSKKITYI